MAKIKRCSIAVVVPLLVVPSLILGGLCPPLYSARANPGELYAAPAVQGSGDCSNWDNACTLQTALGQAVSGDEIWVQEGVHTPGSIITNTFSLKNGVALYGGFAGWESELGQRDWIANITVLSGDIGQDDLTDPTGVVTDTVNIQGENAYHVVTGSGVTETAVLDGFVITAGQAKGDAPDNDGGGMFNNDCNPLLANVTFSGNYATDQGGGMYNGYSSPTLTGTTFSGNYAIYGGGMYNDYSDPPLTEVTFSGNHAHGGGGIYNQSSSPTLTDVTFNENWAYNYGGGMQNVNSDSVLTDVTFSGNSAFSGGGMFNNGNNNLTLTNVTFNGNSADEHGGGMLNIFSSGNLTLTGVAFSANAALRGGGMANIDNCSPTLMDVSFSNNSATVGGGMFNNTSSSPTLTGVTFSDNNASYEGGGMTNWSSSPTLTDVTFSGNSADEFGGGMFNNNNSSPALTHVTFSGNSASLGGGMHNRYDSSPTLTNTIFSGNSADLYGGGMDNYWQCSPVLTNVTFSGNSATYGGGLSNYYTSSPILTGVTFSGNTATNGGGIYNYYHTTSTLTGVTFSGNLADENGGGMYNQNSNPTLTNVTFSGNSASLYGGGMNINSGSSPTLTNVTFNDNSAGENGGGMYHSGNSNSMLTNIILWGNTALNGAGIYNDTSTPQISYSDIQGCGGSGNWDSACGADGGGNIEADPLFLDPVNGNLRLQLASPAIDAGDNAAFPPDIFTDLDGNPRFVDMPIVPDTGSGAAPIVDMGAYEAQFIDVTLSKAVLPPEAAPGEAITFSLTLTNTGSLLATGIVVTDTLPALLWGVSFTSTLTVTDTGYLPPYVWQAQDLAPGQVGVITASGVLTLPLAAGIFTNTAFIAAAGDLLAENNTAIITFSVPNLAPVFTSAPVITAMEDAPYTYATTAQDDNGDGLAITASTLPAWLALEDHGDGTATLDGTPATADVGEHAVVLQVTDSGGLTNTQSFTITIAYLNDSPFFTSTPVLTATQDAPYSYAIAADDPDLIHGDELTITAPTLPAWLTHEDHGDGTATLSGAPTNADVGDHDVVLLVTDSGGLTGTQSFTVTVANVNDAPFFTSTPVLTATQDAPYAYVVTADDPDLIHGDALTITAPTLPGWLTLEDHGDGTAALSGMPVTLGDYPVILRVTDHLEAFAEQSFTITVSETPGYYTFLPLMLRSAP